MNSTTGLPSLPNPLTPLAWLPPDVADQFQASDYLFVATLGAWIWDFLVSMGQEYTLLFKHRFSLPQLGYIISRLFTFLYILLATIFQVGSISNCQHFIVAIGAIGTVAVPANSFLMYLRVCAVYSHSVFVKTFFTVSWVGVLGTAFTAPFSIQGAHIGTTQRCIDSSVKSFAGASLLAAGINDTLIFFAITYRLLTAHVTDDSWSARLKSFLRGEGLHTMPKLLMQTGQVYYAATAGMNIFTVISVMSSGFPPIMRAMFTVPNGALTNAMACRVFRQVKLGTLMDGHHIGTSRSQRSAPIQLLPSSQFSKALNNGSIDTNKTKVAVEIHTHVETEEQGKDSHQKGRGITDSNV